MNTTTSQAKAMTDEALAAEGLRLRREIPRQQSLLDAIKREARRRARAHKQQGASHGND